MSLELTMYKGQLLTAQEILYTKLIEGKREEIVKAREEAILERKLLSNSSSISMQSVERKPQIKQEVKKTLIAPATAPAKTSLTKTNTTKSVPEPLPIVDERLKKKAKFEEPTTVQTTSPPIDQQSGGEDNDSDEENFDNIKPIERSDSLAYPIPVTTTDIKSTIRKPNTSTFNTTTEPEDQEHDGESSKPIKKIGKKASLFASANDDDDVMEEEVDPNVVFSKPNLLFDGIWNSKLTPVDQTYALPNFNDKTHDYQTLAIKITVPRFAREWALNITPEKDLNLSDIFLHFNPRYKKNKLIMTDRQGVWGAPVNRDLKDSTKNEPLLATELDLVIQIRSEGFAIFANNIYCNFFSHRRDLFADSASTVTSLLSSSSGSSSSGSSKGIHDLKLVIPAKDGNGMPEDIIVNKVWWGHTDHSNLRIPVDTLEVIMKNAATSAQNARENAAKIARHTIAVTGILNTTDLVELQGIEYALFDLFEEFGPESISVPPGTGMAFAKLYEESNVPLAISALHGSMIGVKDEDTGDGQFTLSMSRMQ